MKKKTLLAAAALVVALACLLCACGSSDGGSARMTMGTGSNTGTYYIFGGILGQYIQDNTGIGVTVVSTGGSKANIQGIDSGDYQLGTVQSDVIAYAWNGTSTFEEDGAIQSFRVIGGLYAEAVQLVTTDPDIHSVADLAGKNVSIGDPGSGVYFNAIDVLTAAGLTEADINPQYQNFDASVESLQDGKIDAAFIVAGAPTPAITQLTTSTDAWLVPIDGEVSETMMASCPYYTTYAIPAGTYPGQDEDVTTVTIKATMIVSADASEDDVYNVTKAIYDNAEAIAAENTKGAELTIENATSGMTAPFHAGAARYFEEQGVTVETE